MSKHTVSSPPTSSPTEAPCPDGTHLIGQVALIRHQVEQARRFLEDVQPEWFAWGTGFPPGHPRRDEAGVWLEPDNRLIEAASAIMALEDMLCEQQEQDAGGAPVTAQEGGR